jgi:hypothetical protein
MRARRGGHRSRVGYGQRGTTRVPARGAMWPGRRSQWPWPRWSRWSRWVRAWWSRYWGARWHWPGWSWWAWWVRAWWSRSRGARWPWPGWSWWARWVQTGWVRQRLATAVESARQRLARAVPWRPVGRRPAAVGLGRAAPSRVGRGPAATVGSSATVDQLLRLHTATDLGSRPQPMGLLVLRGLDSAARLTNKADSRIRSGPGAASLWGDVLDSWSSRAVGRTPPDACGPSRKAARTALGARCSHRTRTEICILTGHPAGSRRPCANTPTGHRSTPGTRWTRADMAGHSGAHNEVKTADLCQDA